MVALLQVRPAFPEGVSLVRVAFVILFVIATFFLREVIRLCLDRQ